MQRKLKVRVKDWVLTLKDWRVEVGNSLHLLKLLPTASIDSVVCDPPYELGFMGKDWDRSGIAYRVDLWREVLRVLKPGGHLLAFGGTRTYHRMTVAIEDAGFEIRDSLHWVYGQGFPKSLNVSKAIVNRLGHVREVIREEKQYGKSKSRESLGEYAGKWKVTLPSSDQAKQWEGWGTAMKPSHEPVVLARKPVDGPISKNVLEHGTGGINVGVCRVGAERRINPPGRKGVSTFIASPITSEPSEAEGRWPPNVLLSHSSDCNVIGKRTIPGVKGGGFQPSMTSKGYKGGGFGHPDSRGKRKGNPSSPKKGIADSVVPLFRCIEGCPIREIDKQSGNRKVGNPRPDRGGGIWSRSTDGVPCGPQYGDTGGMSRVFPVFYTAKPGRSEREAGCSKLPLRSSKKLNEGGIQGRRDKGAEEAIKKAEVTSQGLDARGRVLIREDGTQTLVKRWIPQHRANTHPTVKPIKVMRWLCKLITPPGGIVLDPFTGSGTTGCAAVLEGFRFFGMELGEGHAEIARARIAHWKTKRRAGLGVFS